MKHIDDVAHPTLTVDMFDNEHTNYGREYCSPGMTIRQYAAIHLRVPNSGLAELDAMINQRLRDDIMLAAISAGSPTPDSDDIERIMLEREQVRSYIEEGL